AVVSNQTRASSQGGVDALANLFGATAAFAAGPLLAVSSFTALNVLSIIGLVPLIILTVGIGRINIGAHQPRWISSLISRTAADELAGSARHITTRTLKNSRRCQSSLLLATASRRSSRLTK